MAFCHHDTPGKDETHKNKQFSKANFAELFIL